MGFPLSLSDFGLWLASTAVILLITTEILIPYLASLGNIIIERKRLRIIAAGFSLAFVFIVILRSFQPL